MCSNFGHWMKYLLLLALFPIQLFAQVDNELELFVLTVSESCQGDEPVLLNGHLADVNNTAIPSGGYYEIESCFVEPCADAIFYNEIDEQYYFDTNAPEDSYLISYSVGTGPFVKKYISQFDLQAANAQIIILDSSICNSNISYIQPNPKGGILSGMGIESDSLGEEINFFFNPKNLLTDTTYTISYEYSIAANSGLICTDISQTTITVYDSLYAKIIPDTIVVCSEKSILLSVELIGDTSEVQIDWYNPDFGIINNQKDFITDTITTSGRYYVNVANKNGCGNLESVYININPPPKISCSVSSHVSCYGGSDGHASVTSDESYSYAWNDGHDTALRKDLSYGVYTVTVTDENSCSDACSIRIQQPEPLSINCTTNIKAPSCHDGANGTNKMTILGGTAPYRISQNNIDYTQTDSLMFLSSGAQKVYVLDSQGCSEECEFTIENPEKIECQIKLEKNISCFGYKEATLSISSLSELSQIVWNTGDTTEIIDKLSAGNYSATITSTQGCNASCSITVTEPDPLVLKVDSYQHPVCYGDSKGYIELSASGGNAPYLYSLNGSIPQTNPQFQNLPSGIYTVQVTDNNQCATTTVQLLIDPLKFEGSIHQQNEILCSSDLTGSLRVEYTQEISEVLWSTGSNADLIKDLAAGVYSVTLTNDEGCRILLEEEIKEPTPLTITHYEINNVDCYGESTGSISVDLIGGTPPYSYQWSNGVTDLYNPSLSAGAYVLSITDANNCQISSESIIVTEQDAWSASIDPIRTCLDEKINLQVDVTGHNPDRLAYQWYVLHNQIGATDDLLVEQQGQSIIFDAFCLPEGVVEVGCIITDAFGCRHEVTTSITLSSCYDLAIRKTVEGDLTKERGESVIFDITVFNQGDVTAYDLTIQDFPESELIFIEDKNTSLVTGNPYNWSVENKMITTHIDSIAAQSAVTLKIYFQIINDTEKRTLYNEAEIISYSSRHKKLPYDQDDPLSDTPMEKDDDIADVSLGTIDNPDDDDQRDGATINLCPSYQHQVIANLCGTPDPILLMDETLIAELDPEGDGDGDDSDGDRGNAIVSFHDGTVSALVGDSTSVMVLNHSDEIYARLLTKEACVSTIPLQLEFYTDPVLPEMQEIIFVSEGEDVALSVKEQPDYNYQWQVEQNQIYQDIPMATSSTLVIESVSPAHNNSRYRVVLSHATAPVSCSVASAVTTLRITPRVLVCTDKLNTNLNENCNINLSATQLLQNSTLPDSLFTVVYQDNTGLLLTESDFISYVGKEINYVVTNKLNELSCWGHLLIVDNTAPVISCPEDTMRVPCYLEDDLVAGLNISHEDNCSSSTLIIEESELELNCTEENSVRFSAYKKIKLYAVDAVGNKSRDCTIEVLYQSANIDSFIFPSNIILDQPNWDLNNNEYPDPEETGTIMDQDSVALSETLEYSCNLKMHFEDLFFPLCGESYIIVRKWTLVDWCSQQIRNLNQFIRVNDLEGPILNPLNIDTVLHINMNSCIAEYTPLANHLAESESSSSLKVNHYVQLDSDTLYSLRQSYPQDSIPSLELEEGMHRIDVQYFDDCGIFSTGYHYVTVAPPIPISAVCKSYLNVQLQEDETLELKAEDLDNHTLSFCDQALHFGLRALPETNLLSSTQQEVYAVGNEKYYNSILIDSNTETLELVVFTQHQHSLCRTQLSNAGIEKRNNNNSTTVYPNPFTNEVMVRIESDRDQEINLELYSMTGQIVYAESYRIERGIKTITLDDEQVSLNSGTYMLVITGEDYLYSSPIVKVE